MSATEERTAFEGWAIIELMGHRRLGGYLSEQQVAGAAFVRVDVPEHPWRDGCTCGSATPESADYEAHDHTCQMFRAPGDDRPLDVHATQFYASAAVYCITPTTEEMARAVRSRPTPVQSWELPKPAALPVGELLDDDPPDLDDLRDDAEDEWPL